MKKPELPGQTFRELTTFQQILDKVYELRPDWTTDQKREEAQAAFARKQKQLKARATVNTNEACMAHFQDRTQELAKEKCPGLVGDKGFTAFVNALSEEFGKRVDITDSRIFEGATEAELEKARDNIEKANDGISCHELLQMQEEADKQRALVDATLLKKHKDGTLAKRLEQLRLEGNVAGAEDLEQRLAALLEKSKA